MAKMENLEFSMFDALAKKTALLMHITGEAYITFIENGKNLEEIYDFQQFHKLFPKIEKKEQKSNASSEQLRHRGNQAFRDKNYDEALLLYTKAICCAELGGKAIAIAYANRSAVSFELQAYSNSIQDVHHALSTGTYPDHLSHKLYERRGKCCLALSQYSKASDDFKQAIAILFRGKVDTVEKVDYVKSLFDLIAECADKTDLPLPQPPKPLELTHDQSPHIPSASSAVTVRFSPKMGRHVVATIDISPGDILAVEEPFASTLKITNFLLYCDNCQNKTVSSIPCKSCNDVVFCSELCREQSWDSHHAIECDLLPTLISCRCDSCEFLAIRAFLKATKCGEGLQKFVGEIIDEMTQPARASKGNVRKSKKEEKKSAAANALEGIDYRSIHHLVTHQDDRHTDEMLVFSSMATSFIHVLRSATKYFSQSDSYITSAAIYPKLSDLSLNHVVAAKLFLKYLMITMTNAYSTEVSEGFPKGGHSRAKDSLIGAAIYPFFSLLNHSCDPDVAYAATESNKLVMYAIKPVAEGQQIFVTYNRHFTTDDRFTRQIELQRNHFFTCECQACYEGWPMLSEMSPGDEPIFVSVRAKKKQSTKIRDLCSRLSIILCASEKNEMTRQQFQEVVEMLSYFHKYVKQPWALYYLAQRAIGNYYHAQGIRHRQYSTSQSQWLQGSPPTN